MKALLWAAAGLWVAAIALIVESVVTRGATVSLVIIIPVVTGSSPGFLLGVVLLIGGFVVLVLAFAEVSAGPETPPSRPSPVGSTGSGGGGFVLIGPVPIVFGSWRGISRRGRWRLALSGALLLIAVVLASVWFLR